jgi:hypothetical protein
MRVEEDRARLRPDDRDRLGAGAQQTLSKDQGVGKAAAGLTELDIGAAVAKRLCDLADVWRHRPRRRSGMTDQVREITHRKAGFA